jgi:hypothetical protein
VVSFRRQIERAQTWDDTYWPHVLWKHAPATSEADAIVLFQQLDTNPAFVNELRAYEREARAERIDWAKAPPRPLVSVAVNFIELRVLFARDYQPITPVQWQACWILFCDGVRRAADREGDDVAEALRQTMYIAVHGPAAEQAALDRVWANTANKRAFALLLRRYDAAMRANEESPNHDAPLIDEPWAADALRHLANLAVKQDRKRWRVLRARGRTRVDLQAAILAELERRYPEAADLLGILLAGVGQRLAIVTRAGMDALMRETPKPSGVREVGFVFYADDHFDADAPRDLRITGVAPGSDGPDSDGPALVKSASLNVGHDELRLEIDSDLLAQGVQALRRRTGRQGRRFAVAERALLSDVEPTAIAREAGIDPKTLERWRGEYGEALRQQIYKIKNRKKAYKA